MRSLVVFHSAEITGPQQSLLPVIGWLGSQGEVECVAPERGPIVDEHRLPAAVSVLDFSRLTYPSGRGDRVRLARRLAREVGMFRRELRRRRPDLVVAVTTVLPTLVLAARLERIPTVVYAAELYDTDWTARPLRRLWGLLLAGLTTLASDGIVSCSLAVARQFPRWTGVRMSVGYPPIGTDYDQGSRERGRAWLGIPPDAPCLVTVGSITRGRGQDVALRALALIRRDLPAARLVVVGVPHTRGIDHDFARELHSLAQSLGIADAVMFAGRVGSVTASGQIADVYAAADVVVNPVRAPESFGRAGPEALVAGRPVVASRVGGLPEVLRDGIDALLVPPNDPPALAAAVMRLFGDAALSERLVASGRRRVLETFGPENALEAWKAVVEPVMRRSANS